MFPIAVVVIALASVAQADYLNASMPQTPYGQNFPPKFPSFGPNPQSPSQPEAASPPSPSNAQIQLYPAPPPDSPSPNPFKRPDENAQPASWNSQQPPVPTPPSQTNSSLSPQMPDFSRKKTSDPMALSSTSSLPSLAAAFNRLALDPAIPPGLLMRLLLLNPKFYAPQLNDSALASQFNSDVRMLSIVQSHSHSHERHILQVGVGSGFLTAALALLSHSTDQITAMDTDYSALAQAWEHLNIVAGPLMSNSPAKRIELSHIQNSDYSDLPEGLYDAILVTQPLSNDALPPEVVKRAKAGSCLIVYIVKNGTVQQLKLARKTGTNSVIVDKVMNL